LEDADLVDAVRVLVCDPIHPEGLEALRSAGLIVDERTKIEKDELLKLIPDYEVIIVRSRTRVDSTVLRAGSRLKVVARAGIGLDNIDLQTARELGIKVLNTPEASTEAAAENTIALLLALARQIPRADRAMKEGMWIKRELVGWELKGKTLGIIGFGRIGRRVAEIAHAFGMKIMATKHVREPPKELVERIGAKIVPIGRVEELLAEVDVVSLHMPLTPETHHFMNRERFNAMRDGSYLINTSRGGLVDEEALLEALKSGKLAGAALDVYEEEPPKNLELIRMPNVICTPHISAQTREAQRRISITLAQKILDAIHEH